MKHENPDGRPTWAAFFEQLASLDVPAESMVDRQDEAPQVRWLLWRWLA